MRNIALKAIYCNCKFRGTPSYDKERFTLSQLEMSVLSRVKNPDPVGFLWLIIIWTVKLTLFAYHKWYFNFLKDFGTKIQDLDQNPSKWIVGSGSIQKWHGSATALLNFFWEDSWKQKRIKKIQFQITVALKEGMTSWIFIC